MAYQSARAARNAKYAATRTQTTRMAAVSMDGMEELEKFFEELIDPKTRLKVMSGAVRAGLSDISAKIKKAVNSAAVDTQHGDDVRAAARKTVGSYFKKFPRKGGYTAKVGFGVGMRGSKRLDRLTEGTSEKTGSVGIAGANIHWWVLGTKGRRTKSGGYTGKIRPFFKGIVSEAQKDASGTVVPKMLKRAKATLKRICEKRNRRMT